MNLEQYQTCIDACIACAQACEHCASACLQEEHVDKMRRCIQTDIDCAQICWLAAAYMSRGSEFVEKASVPCVRRCALPVERSARGTNTTTASAVPKPAASARTRVIWWEERSTSSTEI